MSEGGHEKPITGFELMEVFPDGRKLYTSGEILTPEGELWGYRLYKGVQGISWDAGKGEYIDPPVHSKEEHQQLLASQLAAIQHENIVHRMWKYENNMTSREQLSLVQVSSPWSIYKHVCYSWTRNPNAALVFTKSKPQIPDDGNIVLQVDVPADVCVSQERLMRKAKTYNPTQEYPQIGRIERESEVTVFEHLDGTDPRVTVWNSSDFRQVAENIRFDARLIFP